ncbi:DUF2147 domain-containing protein [Pseudomonas fuscovaginae UPB0736]|uniref:DUF2147 domain-containing protein n=1 Tax=Pseudomonas asplenii TaxID=53407 RepID=UPI000494C33E|nr:DUF2147 domain-containing protein [Pseudomonas fuscovaginae]UUQ64479.1 DUF2147 domain-containing protein [Pseudomonas fuscovaginae UPB0736]
MNLRQGVVLSLVGLLCASGYAAQGPTEAKGLWLTEDEDAVIRLADCPTGPSMLCGEVVWVKDASSVASDCGTHVLQMSRYDSDAWRDGWVYDPRDHKKYKGVVRLKDGLLNIRAFVGTEILGKTEVLKRVETFPTTPVCPA